MLIGLVGFMNSGKGTAGEYLINNYGFIADSWAKPVKDAASIIFGWDRKMLEGDTLESRIWREKVDKFWAKQLNDKKFTPRKALQLLGTEAGRNIYGNQLWIASLFNRWEKANKPNTVIVDCRFPNEIESIRKIGGKVIRIKRGPDPVWYQSLLFYNRGFADEDEKATINKLRVIGNIPHESETAWIGCSVDAEIINDGTKEEFNEKIKKYMDSIL